jgi:hypothetical protein
VVAPLSFILSTPPVGSQFGVKNRLPFRTTGAGVDSKKSIAWKLPVNPLIVTLAQQAPYQVIETLLSEAMVTVAVAVPKPGAVAVIVTDPAATPVTGTLTLPEPAAPFTVTGTVATLGLLELRVTISPPAAADDRFRVRFCVEPTLTVKPLTGEKKLLPPLAVTWTWVPPAVKPGADAVMLADPSLRPLTWGCMAGNVVLAGMKTLGVTAAVDVSLLANETVTPPEGAGVGKAICSAAD